MRVAMVAYAYYEGNGRIEQYAKALAMRGDTVDVISLNRGGDPKFEKRDGVNIYRAQTRTRNKERFSVYVLQVMMFMIRSFFSLARRQLKGSYDAIHVHSVPDFLVFSALIPKLSGVPIILDIHDILPEFYMSKFGVGERSLIFKVLVFVEKISIAFSNHVIIANPIWRDRLLRRSVKPEKVTAIGNYPDPKIFFLRAKTRTDGKFVLLYPGSLNFHQGLDIGVRAFAKVARQMLEAEFRIYGEGPERENLIQIARECHVDDKVLLSDFLPMTEVAEIMANSDLAIVPKRSRSTFGTEAASTKIMEFMSVGVPVIVSRTKIDSFYHTDATVRFFDNDDPDELAKAILDLHANPESRKRLAVNALEYVAKNNWEAKKGEYLAIVDGLGGRNRVTQTQEAESSLRRAAD
jgi:glycosyltransferase involved in cell wall biosynthesis